MLITKELIDKALSSNWPPDPQTTEGRLRFMTGLIAISGPQRFRWKEKSKVRRRRQAAKLEKCQLANLGFHFNVKPRHIVEYLRWNIKDRKWRLYPRGLWVEPSGAIVVFDRIYCPLVRIALDRPPEIVPPYQRIKFVEQRWFYTAACCPISDPDTLNEIRAIASLFGLELEHEIELRSRLTNGAQELQHWCLKELRW